jgi:hypothetical protein
MRCKRLAVFYEEVISGRIFTKRDRDSRKIVVITFADDCKLIAESYFSGETNYAFRDYGRLFGTNH